MELAEGPTHTKFLLIGGSSPDHEVNYRHSGMMIYVICTMLVYSHCL